MVKKKGEKRNGQTNTVFFFIYKNGWTRSADRGDGGGGRLVRRYQLVIEAKKEESHGPSRQTHEKGDPGPHPPSCGGTPRAQLGT